jgi:hypothetical protein
MHDLEPFYRWDGYYNAARDERSPFAGVQPNYQAYENDIYGFYIHPDWDFIGSETLYCKLLFADYDAGFAVLEMMGEWNDTLHNDIMHLKRNVIDLMIPQGLYKFILLGENILNFHGGDDDYYQEWFDEVDNGWIAFVNVRPYVETEMSRYRLDYYLSFGGTLNELEDWRTQTPWVFCTNVQKLILRRIGEGS